MVLGRFKGDVRPNRAFNASGHDWVKLISGAAVGIERGLGSGSLRPCESRDAAGLSPAGSPGCKRPAAAELAGQPGGLRWLAVTGALLATPRLLGTVGLDHAWHGERGSSRGSSLSGRSAGWWMGWPASARHPSQSSPSTVSYSFPVSLPAPPPPLPPHCCPPLGLQSPVLAWRCPLGRAAIAPPQSPAEALGEGRALGPPSAFPPGDIFLPGWKGLRFN